jgi:hypothetical protein
MYGMLPDGFKATFRVGFIYSDQFPAKFLSFPLRFVFEVHRFPVNVQVHKYVVSVDQFDTLTLGFHQAPFLDSVIQVIFKKGVEKVA